MAFDINFGAIQHANPFAAYAQGQEIGQQRRQDQARREAGNVFSTDPERAAQIFFEAGDFEKGVAVREYGDKQRAKKARTEAFGMASGGDIKGAQARALAEDDLETYNAIGKMDETRRAQAKAAAENLAAVGQWVAKLPYGERRAAIQQQRELLISQGLTSEQIDAFDPTDQAIQGFTSQALGLKGMLEQADREADNAREDRKADTAERQGEARIAISRGQLGVAQGNLSQRRAEHAERKAQGGYGGGLTSSVIDANQVQWD